MTERIEFIQRTAKNKDEDGLKKIKNYLDNLDNEIDKLKNYKWWDPREWVIDTISNSIKKTILKKIKKHKPDRFNCSWTEEPLIQKLFLQYFEYCRQEINEINKAGYNLKIPDKIIYGHTHCPIPWGMEEPYIINTHSGEPLELCNTGGWLYKKDSNGIRRFRGAEVITYVSGEGFKSHSIKE